MNTHMLTYQFYRLQYPLKRLLSSKYPTNRNYCQVQYEYIWKDFFKNDFSHIKYKEGVHLNQKTINAAKKTYSFSCTRREKS